MSLFRIWRQVPVMATHSAQTYRQSRSVRTRSETAFTTLVSAFLLFSGPDCHIVRRYFETRKQFGELRSISVSTPGVSLLFIGIPRRPMLRRKAHADDRRVLQIQFDELYQNRSSFDVLVIVHRHARHVAR